MSSGLKSSGVRKILVINGDGSIADATSLGLHAPHAKFRVVQSIDAAVEALRGEAFDLAVCAAGELAPLASAAGERQTRGVLESVGQGICLFAPGGELLWANAKLRSYPRDVFEAVRSAAAELGARLLADSSQREAGQLMATLPVGREYAFDISVSAVLGEDGQAEQLVALVWDASATRRLRERINAIDAAGRELIGLDPERLAKLDFGQRLGVIEEKIVRVARDLLHFDHLVIRLLDPKTNRLDTILAAGLSEEAQRLEIYALAEGNGISGYVAATGKAYLCDDVTRDARYLPGLEGARSSVTVPLLLHDQVVGILNVESDTVSGFTEQDVQYAEILARYVAMSLHVLKMMVVERHTLHGQLAADVDAEVANPLNEIVRDVKTLMADYGTDGGLAGRLREILVEVDHVKEAIHAVTEPGPVQGLVPEQSARDPVIAGRNILVADDEDIIRETVSDLLTKAGANVTTARDGNEALLLIRDNPFDLVLSDIKMPNRNGYEVFAAARAAQAGCAVILITGFGYDPNHAIVRASKEGLNGVLFKPFKIEQLFDEVRHALLAAK